MDKRDQSKKDEIILRQLEVIRSMTEHNLSRMGADFWGTPTPEKHVPVVPLPEKGYDGLMDEFIHSNPGLESRFNRFLHFADYTAEELLAIFRMQCEKGCYILEPEAEAPLRSLLERRMADAASFGNARGVRNLFEQILVRQAGRLAGQASVNREDLTRITAADVEAVGRANDLEAKER